MIALYIAIGAVIGIPLIMFIVGTAMPERYEAKLVAVLNRSPEEVWSALIDYQANPIAGRMRKHTEPLADVNGLPSWKEDMGSSQSTITTLQSDKPTRLLRAFVDSVVPLNAEWDIVLEAVPDGCRAMATNVTIIRSGTWHVPFFRVMVGLFGGARMCLKIYWKSLASGLGASLRFE